MRSLLLTWCGAQGSAALQKRTDAGTMAGRADASGSRSVPQAGVGEMVGSGGQVLAQKRQRAIPGECRILGVVASASRIGEGVVRLIPVDG